MAVKLRLSRHGATNHPFYWLVAADSRFARNGRYLEKLGIYNPMLATENPERLKLNKERIQYWLSVGAQPSERAIKLLSLIKLEGIDKFLNKKKSTIGKPKTIKNPDKLKKNKTTVNASIEANLPKTIEQPVSDENKAAEQPTSDENKIDNPSTVTVEQQHKTKNSKSNQSE